MSLQEVVKRELGTSVLTPIGHGAGGCISSGQGYKSDNGNIFVKVNDKTGAKLMFDGEFASLEAITATKTIACPKPIKVIDQSGGKAAIVVEYVAFSGLGRFAGKLGEQLGRMHKHNEEQKRKHESKESSVHKETNVDYVDHFGFHIPTCCGYIPQDNTWEADWTTFFVRHKLQQQIDLLQRESGDRQAVELWGQLIHHVPAMFAGLSIVPALLHGDLWGGNADGNSEGPVIFDPASFYGHSEFDLGIATMFGGFGSDMYKEYHKIIPKDHGFSTRNTLYQLFHYLNHWNHFGSGYKSQSIRIMKQLLKDPGKYDTA